MFRFAAILLFFIGLLNAVAGGFANSYESTGKSTEFSFVDHAASGDAARGAKYVASPAASDHKDHEGCDDHAKACRHCHLGHCQFTTTAASSQFLILSVTSGFSLVFDSSIPTVIIPGLAEPPSV